MVAPAAAWDPIYETEDGWTVHRYELATGNVLRFAARDIRREKTGAHANISISINWVSLAWSNFNIERDEDRVRLANSAYKHLDGKEHELDRAEFPQNLFKHALDLFSIGLWDEVVGKDLGGLLQGDPNVKPAKPLLSQLILDEAGTIIYAPPGKGKSYTALCMAVSLQYGRDDVWKLTDTRTPLYINLERSERSMQGRLALVNQALGLSADEGIYFLNKRGRSLNDIYESAKRTIDLYGCDIIFFDSISRGGAGSMIADDVANRIMDMLSALCPTWVALGHSPRGDDAHIYGSQMFDGACDLGIQLQSQTSADGRSTGIRMKVSKANDVAEGFAAMHVLEWGTDGLSRVRAARQGEFAELESSRKIGIAEACQKWAETQPGQLILAGDVAREYELNRSNVADFLSKSAEWAVVKRGSNNAAYYGRVEVRQSEPLYG